jgi:hypothetical protein
LADHALFKKVRYVLLRPLKPELDGQDKNDASKTNLTPLPPEIKKKLKF